MAAARWATLEVTSPDFSNNGKIPATFTCEGRGINPSLRISDLPLDTRTLVLIMDDPDAPRGTFDHWIVWNIPPTNEIAENSVPGTVGKNSLDRNDYTPPCPPSGTHRYFFKVYALDTELDLPKSSRKHDVEKAMTGHIIAFGEVVGVYRRTADLR